MLRNIKLIVPDCTSGDFIFSLKQFFNLIYNLYCVNVSFDENIFPEIIKISSVMYIHKSGDVVDVSNHHLISIINHFSKFTESIILLNTQPSVNSKQRNK